MAYITRAQLKVYLGISEAGDDVLLDESILEAQSFIEAETGRSFEAVTDTKYYLRDALSDDDEFMLLLDDDLLTVTTLTNGDSDATAIAASEFVLWPRNYGPPYWGIKLDTDSTHSWEWDTDYYVSVLGTWGYSATASREIQHATKRMAAYYYRQKDSQVFEAVAVPEAGIITIPQGTPADVANILKKYRKMAPVL